ncbi:MAG: malonyl CoA-acyl carrier protein transacylase [Phycisphaerae bacterium]|nr:MAG: malonyl CoA-acyl carrier protein transacylase [Phycisphaerae bacterium]
MQNKAAIFPGQGSQLSGMGADLVDASQRAKDVYAKANELVGFDLRALCFEGTPEQLEATDIQQPAILVTSIALLEALGEQVDVRSVFPAAAGLSLGEYSALYHAGCLGFDDVVRLVHRRGQLMQAAADAADSGMVSLIGVDEAQAKTICDEAAQGGVLSPANLNCPGQIVISGDQAACDRSVEVASEKGFRAVPLKVAGAFHSPLMQSAADGLAEVLAEIEIKKPIMPVLSNVTGGYHEDPESIRKLLVDQVTQPVRWQDCVEKLIADGYQEFAEIGPNRVLKGLVRKINKSARTVSVGKIDDIKQQDMASIS